MSKASSQRQRLLMILAGAAVLLLVLDSMVFTPLTAAWRSRSAEIARLTRLVLPSSLPYIFTGMRLSLGTGWMVLIAAEMLAQNPGLGKFVWDEFQNGSEKSLARIMVAVVVIGLIGFALDRVMMAMQAFVSRNRNV